MAQQRLELLSELVQLPSLFKSIFNFDLDSVSSLLHDFDDLVHAVQERDDLTLQNSCRLYLHFHSLVLRFSNKVLGVQLLQILKMLHDQAFVIWMPHYRQVSLDGQAFYFLWISNVREFFNTLDAIVGHGQMSELLKHPQALQGDQVIMAQK